MSGTDETLEKIKRVVEELKVRVDYALSIEFSAEKKAYLDKIRMDCEYLKTQSEKWKL